MIHEIRMINWRAYEDQTFTFMSGINFIMGPNGKGKTSILEAISYALTGDSSIVTQPIRLIRDSNQPAKVVLIFGVEGKKYKIDRTILPERAGDAYIYELDNNKQLASSNKRVTDMIEKILGVSKDFLKRIVYMSEGDVFHFLNKPPGEIMNFQVRRVLGMTQLDQFKTAIKLAKSELNDLSKKYKIIQQRMNELHILTGQELNVKQAEITSKKEILMAQVFDLQNQILQITNETQSLALLNREIEKKLQIWQTNEKLWFEMKSKPLILFYDELQADLSQKRLQNVELEKDLARLRGQRDSYQRVMEILEGVDKIDLVPCPICKKPMTSQEQHEVELETVNNIEKITEEINSLQVDVDISIKLINDLTVYLESIRDIRNDLVHNKYSQIDHTLPLTELIQAVQNQSTNEQLVKLTERQNSFNFQIKELEQQQAEFISIKTQLNNLGFSQPSELKEAQIKNEERNLVLSAADDAIGRTLSDLQNFDLEPIYEQIARIWNNFIRYGTWHLKFDSKGTPLLLQDESRDFNFDQFSGGEKTALLVIIHTIIGHHFSKCNFLMIDEPLEHLDPINRRSLVSFFISACKNQFFEQALITTYEESLVRKYISDKNVNILHIQ
jgi:exonuclease SbcC